MMTVQELLEAVAKDVRPPASEPLVLALWCAGTGRWHEAHELCQELDGPAGSWLHAWLHRKEGDHNNAEYWYRRAQQTPPSPHLSCREEWHMIVSKLLTPS